MGLADTAMSEILEDRVPNNITSLALKSGHMNTADLILTYFVIAIFVILLLFFFLTSQNTIHKYSFTK
jgi:hypothetical protein